MTDETKTEKEDNKDDGPKMVKMYKRDGTEVKVNDSPANLAAAEKAGFSKTKPKKGDDKAE